MNLFRDEKFLSTKITERSINQNSHFTLFSGNINLPYSFTVSVVLKTVPCLEVKP